MKLSKQAAKATLTAQATLEKLLKRGDAWLEGDTLVGRAADGVEVVLGALDDYNLPGTLAYLAEHPSPSSW